jgi:hypothetical protein
MRAVAVLCVAGLLSVGGRAVGAPPQPIAKLTAPEGTFFDDPIALSRDGKSVALISTDAAKPSCLHLWTPESKAELRLEGLPTDVVSVGFVAPGRVVVVFKQGDQLAARVAMVKADKLVLDKVHLGPADAIDVIDREGKRAIALYSRVAKKGGASHDLEVFSGDSGRLIGHRAVLEDAEGLLRTSIGAVRPLWWSDGHTRLAAQRIGDYDKARDMRRPDRFARIDVVTNKAIAEQEIGDVTEFTKVVLAHKTSPTQEAFARMSEDRKEVLIDDGLFERTLPLARAVNLYEPTSLRSVVLDDKTLLVGLQIDPGNISAVDRRERDPDELDLYVVERATMSQKELAARRVLTLPGDDRPAAFTAVFGRVAVLRKGKGFERGGMNVELYVLP